MKEMIRKDVLSWGVDVDEQTADQAKRVADLAFVEKPLALMADAHLGYGSTIGSVIATRGAVIPGAVGVDIGCGMIAQRTLISESDLPDDLRAIHRGIEEAVPAGNNRSGSHESDDRSFSAAVETVLVTHPNVDDRLRKKVYQQIGTLGGGNHFIELLLDEIGNVWVVLHSGSRGAGHMVAQHHIAIAKEEMARVLHAPLDDMDLAYFVQGQQSFADYIDDMLWAQDYALANREVMMDAVLDVLAREVGLAGSIRHGGPIQCHHNYCTKEHHHGKNVWVTRKGAINAAAGKLGVIPGSMATGSYIVEGRGDASSYTSASHGAGRKMSRTKARKTLTEESLNDVMNEIVWNNDAAGLLDEHPEAYKDIDEVMEAQSDLVDVRHKLTTILNYKGA